MSAQESASRVVVALMTAPDLSTAESIGRILVEERRAACCNLLPQARSIYRWEGSIEQADEIVVIIKTTADAFDAMRERILELHPYDVPEVMALGVGAGNEAYLQWVIESVGGTDA